MPRKIATVCYIPELSQAAPFLEHIKKWERRFPLYVTTDGTDVPGTSVETIRIPRLGPFTNQQFARFNRPSDRYATLAFIHSFLALHKRGFEWLLWLETDCRVKGHNWDSDIADSLDDQRWIEPPVIGGSPVVWHPWSKGHEWSRRIVEFAFFYQRDAGVPLAFEGAHDGPCGFTAYPNGALALYKIADLFEFFDLAIKAIEEDNYGPHQYEKLMVQYMAFDLHVGRSLVSKYGLTLFDKFAWTRRAFSGCGDYHTTEGERLAMLKRGLKSAVHQVKSATYD